MIKRKLSSRILKLLQHFPAVALIGPRQVGKTTLAKLLQEQFSKKSTYLDLERYEDLAKLENPSFYLENLDDECIILDEIQKLPEIFPELRSLIDRNRVAGRFLILGSASPKLIKQSSESLAGRISYVELTPFHLGEIEPDDFQDLWIRGGFPEPFLINDDELRKEWYHSFITTYIERDLPLLGLKTSTIQLRTFINMLAGIQGNIINQQMLSRSLGVSTTTVVRYFDFLENSFLIRRLQPFHINIKKRMVKSPKVYIRDTGILHYLLQISTNKQLWDNMNLGASWESLVIEQIIANIEKDIHAWFYRTQDGTECDLVLTLGNKPLCCIETKITSAPKKTKSLTIAINDLGTDKNFIIVPKCDESYHLSDKIIVCNLFSFLLDYLPNIASLNNTLNLN
ncbi:ATP-binding protein [Bacteroidota bacterium]